MLPEYRCPVEASRAGYMETCDMQPIFADGGHLYSSMPGIEPSEWSRPERTSTIVNNHN